MLQLERFVSKLGAINRFPSAAVATREIPALQECHVASPSSLVDVAVTTGHLRILRNHQKDSKGEDMLEQTWSMNCGMMRWNALPL